MRTCATCGASFRRTPRGRGQRYCSQHCRDTHPSNREYWQQWAERNREYNRERTAAWKKANRERLNAYAQQYRQKSEAPRAADSRKRSRARKAAGDATATQIQARIAFFGGRCWMCGTEDADTIDHVKPLARGGSNWPANLRPACRSCNAKKGARAPRVLKAQKGA